MPWPDAFVLPHGFWSTVTRLGESQLLLPTSLILLGWLAWAGERRSAVRWAGLLGVAIAITTACKIAFIGWGLGIARLNFTGFSGHAMFSAAVLPMLLGCLNEARGTAVRRLAIALGFALAALVAVSRVAVGAHSPIEAVAGFALGGLASGFALALGHLPEMPLPRWLLAVLVAAQLVNPVAMPELSTHDFVTRIALRLSGHEKPYTRRMMLREEHERRVREAGTST